jgi:hypothetical protein
VVLARSVVTAAPSNAGAPAFTFFEDFSTDDPLTWIPDPYAGTADPHPSLHVTLWQNTKWNFLYEEGYPMWPDHADPRVQTAFHVEGGAMHNRIQDWGGNFATQLMVPRRTAALSDQDYLHVTYEVDSNTTQRRYWWLGLCGDPQAGQTLRPDGQLMKDLILQPFFYEPDGLAPAAAGRGPLNPWNCLQIFTLYATPFLLAPDQTRSEADMAIVLNRAGATDGQSIVQVGDFHREVDAAGNAVDHLMDDRIKATVRTRFDVYVRRDRVVVYIEGKQKVCADFAATPLDMAEAAVAFGNVFYHSASDRYDLTIRGYDAQHNYLDNLPFVDTRSWDNVGFDEHSATPADFQEGRCGTYGRIVPTL